MLYQALEMAGCAPQEAIVMGDSVTADIAAANAAGVESILFTEGKEPPEGHGATYVARTYREALDILLAKANSRVLAAGAGRDSGCGAGGG